MNAKSRLQEHQLSDGLLQLVVYHPDCLLDVRDKLVDLLIVVHANVHILCLIALALASSSRSSWTIGAAMVHQEAFCAQQCFACVADHSCHPHLEQGVVTD